MDAPSPTNATTLPLARIKHGENPRRYFDQAKHAEMVASVRLRGILQPLLVRPHKEGDDYAIVAGERRYRAALEVFGEGGEVPVIIKAMTDQEALEAAIDENDIREDASETEQADAAVRVLAAVQNDRAEAAKRLGWSTAKLDRRLALANLSGDVKAALDERRIKVGHAELLAAVPGDKQDQALQTIVAHGLDVNKTRDVLMRMTQSLAAATFDKGECLTCPFNSASQRALFETHVDDGFCTNPGCFKLKTEGALAKASTPAKAAPATSKGKQAEAPAAPVASVASEGKTDVSTPAGNSKIDAATVPPPASPKASPAPKTSNPYEKAIGLATAIRQEAWRKALQQAVEGDPEFAAAFDATLRDTWQVDRTFLSRFGKDELSFIAGECGLVDHMGAKAFAKLLESSVPKIIDGMLNAKGFSWAGRLPSAITLDGKYSPPPAGAGLGVHHAQPKD